MRCPQCGGEVSSGASFCDHCGAKVEAQKKQDPLLGRTLLNQYVIRSKLGEGGFGAVYEAEQPSMRRRVAIKTLHRHLIHNPQIVARFHREGMAASQLEHPYAVKMFNSGETEDGILWLAMEFLSGKTLEERIKEGPLPPQEFVAVMSPVCEMLGEAHSKGIVHRDLKPDNIMLVPTPSGQIIPKVLDFGIAGLLESEGSATKSGVISGTPKYMAPEQWEGLKNTDARSDIYSLGVISYQCLSGKLPFHADSVPQWMQKHCFEEPPSLQDLARNNAIPTALVQCIMKSLQKKPADRFQTMLEMREAFQQALTAKEPAPTLMHNMPPVMRSVAPEPQSPPLPSVLEKPKTPSRINSASISIAVIAASLAIGGVVWFLQKQPETKTPETIKPLLGATSVAVIADAPAKCETGDLAACVTVGDQYTAGSAGFSKDGLQALSLYRKACDGGFAEGCVKLGKLFYYGSGGVNADKVKAAEFYKKACDAKRYEGCNELGLQYKYGDGVTKDLVLAAELLLKACDAELWGSCNDLGTMYEKSEGISNDLTKAAAFYEKACAHQFAMSCSNLAWVVKKEPNYPKAISLFTKACDLKDGGGCDGLGLMYQDGTGVPQDDKIAKSFYQKGCDAGSMIACVDLGFFWNNGRGGDKDYAEALTNYKKACDGNYNLGCYNLGFLYGQGLGVAQDRSVALPLYTKACNTGYAPACTEVGYYHDKGLGVAANAATGASFYKKGCDLGDSLGCSNLGLLYQNGTGVSKDLAYAFDLYDKGCLTGHAISCGNLAWMYYNGKVVKKDKARGKSLYKYACDKGDTFSCGVLKGLK
jgi:uncharacterized protein